MKYTKIKGENLIEGNIYYTDFMGINKVIYEGRLKENNNMCLLNPIGNTTYHLYAKHHYNGTYEGKYALPTHSFYYEEDKTSIVRTIKKHIAKAFK
jgi:hypothetical protein